MQTKRSFAMKVTYWLKVVSLGLVLGLGLQFAQAWTAPTVAPPGGNVSGPVTLGVGAQYKTGKLGVNSNITPIGAFEVGSGGNALIGGKAYSASTIATDLGTTLATKDYVDGKAAVGDNLGNHTATQALNMANFDINAAKNVNATAFYYTSDRRLKENIGTLDAGTLEKVLRLNGVSFRWKQDGRQDIGVIAQDVEEVFPELVKTDPTTGFKSVEYGNLVAPLIEAIKAQQNEIGSLEARIRILEGK